MALASTEEPSGPPTKIWHVMNREVDFNPTAALDVTGLKEGAAAREVENVFKVK